MIEGTGPTGAGAPPGGQRRRAGAVPPARAALRAATEAAHARLHAHPAFAALAAGRITRPAYRDLLARLHGLHAPLEARLLAAPPAADPALRMGERRRVHRLRRDLLDLGLDEAAIAALPVAPDRLLPALPADDPGRFLGCLYVREGSALGGRVLARALDPLLGAGGERGRRFLAGDGADHGGLWRGLCAALEAAAAAGHLPGMLDGAREAWLDGTLTRR